MTRHRKPVPALTSISLGLLAAAPAYGASLKQVAKSEWTSGVALPNYVEMHVYVPDKVAAKPPIVVSAHSCGSNAQGQMGNIKTVQAAADKNGFILILPDNPGQNCWDVGTTKSLTHDGGGDTQAVAQMVKYALKTYSGDASRVYIFGGSSGGMLTQAMLAVYPDLFRAGSARAGVPAGCWAVNFNSGQQWSDPCAGGSVTHTAQEWGDMVRAMYSGYTGPRPRVQLIQGGADTTISSKNMPESIKEWTNVLGLSAEPTSKDTGFKGQVSDYDRQIWKNDCGLSVLESWVAPGKNHSMGYEEDAILKFFGLDVAGGADPADACAGGTGGGSGGAGGTSAGGAGGAAGEGGVTASNTGGTTTQAGAAGANTGGGPPAGQSGSGGSIPIGPVSAGSGGVAGTDLGLPVAGSVSTSSGGSSGAVAQSSAGANVVPTTVPGASEESGGCSLAGGSQHGGSLFGTLTALLGFGMFRRRQRLARSR